MRPVRLAKRLLSEFPTVFSDGPWPGTSAFVDTLKQGTDKSKEFQTTRVEDPKLTEELEAKNVKYAGELSNHWLTDVLGWIIPLIFFIGILRQIQFHGRWLAHSGCKYEESDQQKT